MSSILSKIAILCGRLQEGEGSVMKSRVISEKKFGEKRQKLMESLGN